MSKLIFFSLTILVILSTLSSCRKVYDFIHDHPDAHDTLCRITKFNFSILRYEVIYNMQGDPTDILLLDQLISNIEQHFRYDRFHRLTDYFFDYMGGAGNTLTNPDALVWHKYAYPRPGIITDTFLVYQTGPINGPSPKAPAGVRIFVYKFDAADKMIASAETFNAPNQPPLVFSPIQYDARGNKVLNHPEIIYDNAINLYRTNKVWQLVYGDYSRNNPTFTGYSPTNQFGLPTSLPATESDLIYQFNVPAPTYAVNIDIEYACSAPKGPIDY